jgi:hypothetical protein
MGGDRLLLPIYKVTQFIELPGIAAFENKILLVRRGRAELLKKKALPSLGNPDYRR